MRRLNPFLLSFLYLFGLWLHIWCVHGLAFPWWEFCFLTNLEITYMLLCSSPKCSVPTTYLFTVVWQGIAYRYIRAYIYICMFMLHRIRMQLFQKLGIPLVYFLLCFKPICFPPWSDPVLRQDSTSQESRLFTFCVAPSSWGARLIYCYGDFIDHSSTPLHEALDKLCQPA